jgi:hypothetical protein
MPALVETDLFEHWGFEGGACAVVLGRVKGRYA